MISSKADGPPSKDSEDEGRIGIFPNWTSVYWSVLVYGLVVAVWMTIVHALLKISGGLASSEAGFEGTLRVVCYSQAAMVAALVPLVGDPLAIFWSLGLQVFGLARMHRSKRARVALPVCLATAALLLALVLVILRAGQDAAAG